MLSGPVIITVAFLYLGLLFAIAYYGDRRADQGRSLIAKPSIYALSIAVYCTSWTFYGSVGRAASSGVDFLPIYLGPTLTFILGWFVIRKIIRISKVNRTTSIADFISSRYGKSFQLGALVTVIAVVGILPYISLQLKAISTSFSLLLHYPDIVVPTRSASAFFLQDTAFYVALFMAVFAILFGTRHIDASERHEGMVAAIAFESVVKLIAFLAVGESKIELVQPTDDSTGVARFLASKGEGFHHVCFEVQNLAETLLRLEIDGLELIDSAPRRGAEGPVAFIHPRSCHGVLVELIEAPGGPSWESLGFPPHG